MGSHVALLQSEQTMKNIWALGCNSKRNQAEQFKAQAIQCALSTHGSVQDDSASPSLMTMCTVPAVFSPAQGKLEQATVSQRTVNPV